MKNKGVLNKLSKRYFIIEDFKMKKIILFMSLFVFLASVSSQANDELEIPIDLPKTEGSKNFDLEISMINQKGISQFKSKLFSEASESFMKAKSLAQQFRDPGLGIVSFNLGLTLHKLGRHENAVEAFMVAKKYARGNSSILDSKLLRFHECGFNPSIPCDEKPPARMHIEGSD